MLQKPNTVFVGSKFNYAATNLTAGDIVLINANTGAALAAANIATTDAIQIGYVVSSTNIKKTGIIKKDAIVNSTYSAYAAKVKTSSVVDFTGATIEAGLRYVIRIVYKDLYEHPGQFTHSYEVFASATSTPTTVAAAFEAAINAHPGARVTASATTGVLTITAKEVVLNGFGTSGKEAITPYSQVQMNVYLYTTDPSKAYNNVYEAVAGATVVTTPSKPGKGNPYVVRDREQDALGYKGITFRTTWPIIKPELNVNLSKSYDTLVLEYKKGYQSPDNQYVKSTDLAAEIYIDNTASSSAKASDLNTAINTTWFA